MQKVTFLLTYCFLKVLLLPACESSTTLRDQETVYHHYLDSISEIRIDSINKKIQQQCDSTLSARWNATLDSLNHKDSAAHP